MPVDFHVDWTGVPEVEAALENIPPNVIVRIAKEMARVGDDLVGAAKGYAPFRQGRLKASIFSKVVTNLGGRGPDKHATSVTLRVRSSRAAFYGRFLESGIDRFV